MHICRWRPLSLEICPMTLRPKLINFHTCGLSNACTKAFVYSYRHTYVEIMLLLQHAVCHTNALDSTLCNDSECQHCMLHFMTIHFDLFLVTLAVVTNHIPIHTYVYEYSYTQGCYNLSCQVLVLLSEQRMPISYACVGGPKRPVSIRVGFNLNLLVCKHVSPFYKRLLLSAVSNCA